MSSFDDAFDTLIGNEGGYSNNPKDPGGETMWGVTARVARAAGYTGPMRSLPRDTAKEIAKRLYWDPLYLDQFDPRVAFQIFDANYNGGHPVIWMQGAAGVPVDGLLGPATLAAVKAVDPWRFMMRWNALRLRYFTSLKTWLTFGKGWVNRIANNLMKGAA
ncbi:putative Peptidoglycan domain protein [Burkholderia cenocepacia]|uniref:glycoside hydrolase family 108 protein n=1 Tax=Burkholderia cenocepacia TaxID=95486 RepID=UPI0019B7E5E9|nr:glycosyl hydrolase 108 family protein [Burkholderia cenocepacia]CAB5082843.1 putative Peptidoglycan domain protein [Burkholderia cenocepacia]CAB5083527.1 putative Peptidoglycan domain protein [Burkholderia cenocepacia]CAB5087678.1 putative Peptidoglycan domain protein [Burkholderia cenocepacia]CAB5095664.1 putative Peptidoglycan domain protein [Burkholderia cenocepacia]CAB5105050.1 putative Peptidoglycan domain protein [Burkholderia cenocepacia]